MAKLFSKHGVGAVKEGCGGSPVVLATKLQAMYRYQKLHSEILHLEMNLARCACSLGALSFSDA